MGLMKRLFLLVFLGVVAGTVTNCAGTLGNPPPSTSPNPPAAQEVEPVHAPTDADPSSCLNGTWLADNSFFLERIQELGDEVQEVSGKVFVRFDADGTMVTEYHDWMITAVTEGMHMQIVRAGVDRGTFLATQDTVRLNETNMGSMLTVTQGGLVMTIDPRPAAYEDAAYSCSEDAATLETVDGALRLERQ